MSGLLAATRGERHMGLFTSEERRLAAVGRAVAVSILVCLACSWRLWISTRLYPLAPLAGLVPRFPSPLDHAVLAILIGLLAALVVRPRSRPLAAGACGLMALLFLQDQSRLWPSFYLYWLLLSLLAAGRRDGGEPAAVRTLAGMRFAVAAAYFWGGVQKLTPSFWQQEFPWFVQPLTDLLPGGLPGLPVIAVAAAVFEILFGLGLLTRRFRRLALVEALVMHAVILVCIGPLRGHWNDAAWVWSQTMAVLLWLLFAAAPPFRPVDLVDPAPLWSARNLVPALVVVLLGILPVLNNVNLWDSALSINVYTGNVSAARVVMPAGAARGLPPGIAAHALSGREWDVLDLDAWSRQEFNGNTYPELRVFKAVFADICRRLPDVPVRLVVIEKAGWFIPRATTVHACARP